MQQGFTDLSQRKPGKAHTAKSKPTAAERKRAARRKAWLAGRRARRQAWRTRHERKPAEGQAAVAPADDVAAPAPQNAPPRKPARKGAGAGKKPTPGNADRRLPTDQKPKAKRLPFNPADQKPKIERLPFPRPAPGAETPHDQAPNDAPPLPTEPCEAPASIEDLLRIIGEKLQQPWVGADAPRSSEQKPSQRHGTSRGGSPRAGVDERRAEAFQHQQLELLSRIDENLRRLREMAEAGNNSFAAFTQPAF